MNQTSKCLIIVLALVILLGAFMIHQRDRLIYWSNITCHKTPHDLGLEYKTLTFHKNTTAWLTGTEDRKNDHLFVFIPGSASGKACSIALARNLLTVHPDSDFLLTEHPGVDRTKKPNRRDTLELIKQIYMFVNKTWYSHVTFVVSCIGLTFMLKQIGPFLNPHRDSVIIVNAFVEWYKQPVSIPTHLDRALGYVISTMVPYRFQMELNATEELKSLKYRGIKTICFQSTFNTHVKKEHGRMIRDIIGPSHYIEYPSKVQCYLDMKNDYLIQRLRQFCADVTGKP